MIGILEALGIVGTNNRLKHRLDASLNAAPGFIRHQPYQVNHLIHRATWQRCATNEGALVVVMVSDALQRIGHQLGEVVCIPFGEPRLAILADPA